MGQRFFHVSKLMRFFLLIVLALMVSAVRSLPALDDETAVENGRFLREKRQFGFGGPFMGGMGPMMGGMGGWGRPWGGMGGWGRGMGYGGYGGYGGWG